MSLRERMGEIFFFHLITEKYYKIKSKVNNWWENLLCMKYFNLSNKKYFKELKMTKNFVVIYINFIKIQKAISFSFKRIEN